MINAEGDFYLPSIRKKTWNNLEGMSCQKGITDLQSNIAPGTLLYRAMHRLSISCYWQKNSRRNILPWKNCYSRKTLCSGRTARWKFLLQVSTNTEILSTVRHNLSKKQRKMIKRKLEEALISVSLKWHAVWALTAAQCLRTGLEGSNPSAMHW